MATKDTFKTPLPGATPAESGDTSHDPDKISAHTGRAARIGLWALGLGFGGFLLW
ncbi:secretion protein HlyD, partial [Candidatus Berkelbacteria bacterium]|nr:secretion protein HlyD [Candidatus Berkelbacteria bacterium]